VELGVGVRTFVVTPAFYGLLAVVVSTGRPETALGLGAFYGFARGATTAAFAVVVGRRSATAGEEVDAGFGLERALRVPAVLAMAAAALLMPQ
jgi:hypothetical protein